MPTSPQDLIRIQQGLDAVKSDYERENITYEQAKAIFDDRSNPLELRASAQRKMQELVPSSFWNNLQGAAYGVGEGLITPLGMEGLNRLTDGWVNPGVATSGNTALRVGGNIGGSLAGLGKIGAALNLAKATPKVFAGIMGGYGLGQAAGGHYEGERSKEGHREFLTGQGAEVPSYLEPSSISSPMGIINLIGQSGLSALSGGLGQKAALAGKVWSPGVIGAQAGEIGGSMGLAMADSFGGPSGLIDYAKDNPEGLQQMAAVATAMALGGAVGVPLAQSYMNRGRAQASQHAREVIDQASTPSRPFIQPTTTVGPKYAPTPTPLDEDTLNGYRLLSMLNMTESNTPGLSALDKGKLSSDYGSWFVEDEAGKMLQLLARLHEDTLPDVGGNKFTPRWLGGDAEGNRLQLNQAAVTRPGALRFQPADRDLSFIAPQDILPISHPRAVNFYNGPSDTPHSGIMIGAAPENKVVWVKTKDGFFPIPGGNLIQDVEEKAAKAPLDLSLKPPAKPKAVKLPTSPQERRMSLQEIDNRIMGVEKRAQEVTAHSPIAQPGLPFEMPTLPFDPEDILKLREWDLSQDFPAGMGKKR